MTKFGKIILAIVLLALCVGAVYFLQKAPKEEANKVDDQLVFENEILGNKFDLINFSVLPGSSVPASELAFNGTIQGAYFFEGNIQINILDQDKNVLKAGYATATGEWMTAGPVDFSGTIDLTGLPTGAAYFEIHNDNASGLPENDKFIQIPINIQ